MLNITGMKIKDSINEMKNIDIKTVDKSTLIDIRTVTINEKLPVEKRIRQLVADLHNPYCFLIGEIAVKIEYEDTEVTFEQRFERIMMNQ